MGLVGVTLSLCPGVTVPPTAGVLWSTSINLRIRTPFNVYNPWVNMFQFLEEQFWWPGESKDGRDGGRKVGEKQEGRDKG